MDYFLLLAGIVLLLLGGDWLVKAAVDIALRAKISVLVVGMTVVSFATSAPELLVSINAALHGHMDISFGNVVGSNIANIALVLGITAIVLPMNVAEKTHRIDWWVMIYVTLLLFIFLINGLLSFWESLFLVILLVLYNFLQIRASRRSQVDLEVPASSQMKWYWMMLFLIAGIAALRFGSEFLVSGAVGIASAYGISERIIGLTVVSVGTSLPELAASLVASLKGKQDLSIGNLIGSNIFNILAVLGFTGLITELPVQSMALLDYDFPWLLGLSLLLFPFMRYLQRGIITRWQGFILFLAYILYILGVILL